MDAEQLRNIYNAYHQHIIDGTLMNDESLEPNIRDTLNNMLLQKETLDTELLNDVFRKVKQVDNATKECHDGESFLKVANPVYMQAKGQHIGNNETLFMGLVLKGINDIIVARVTE